MSDNTDEAEELLQQSSQQRRHTTEAATTEESDGSNETASNRVSAIKQALVAIDQGDTPENINLRDARLKALLVGLEAAGQLDAVAGELAETVDGDTPTDASQSDVARLLIRTGLQELPELLEDATEARKQKAIEEVDNY
jgi:hypothetical protein